MLSFDTVLAHERVQTDFINSTDGGRADPQRNEFLLGIRPKTLGLQIRQKAVLGFDVRVGHAVSDLNAFACRTFPGH